MSLANVKSLFDSLKFTNKPEPCTEDQIKALEKQLALAFPPDYREFLLWMGQNRCGVQLGAQWMTDDLPDLKTQAVKLLADNKYPQKLPDDAFVFWFSQDYIFTFTRLSQGDASPVYRYHETLDPTDFSVINKNFGDWLSEQIQLHVNKMRSFGKPY